MTERERGTYGELRVDVKVKIRDRFMKRQSRLRFMSCHFIYSYMFIVMDVRIIFIFEQIIAAYVHVFYYSLQASFLNCLTWFTYIYSIKYRVAEVAFHIICALIESSNSGNMVLARFANIISCMRDNDCCIIQATVHMIVFQNRTYNNHIVLFCQWFKHLY